jgi:UDP:flavonoid glycosyltransferase YjiC (YdhE family)
MAALGRGVPLLCTPMGRDQFFNAEQVQNLGAGRMLMPASSSDAIAQAATDILRDDHFTVGATQMAVAIGGCGGALQAAAALETLAAPVVAATPSGSLA